MAASTVPGFLESSIVSPGTAAMMLALTQTIYDEDLAKKLVAKKGLKAVVTEVGGKTSFDKPYPLSRTFLREREKQQFLPEPLLLSFY